MRISRVLSLFALVFCLLVASPITAHAQVDADGDGVNSTVDPDDNDSCIPNGGGLICGGGGIGGILCWLLGLCGGGLADADGDGLPAFIDPNDNDPCNPIACAPLVDGDGDGSPAGVDPDDADRCVPLADRACPAPDSDGDGSATGVDPDDADPCVPSPSACGVVPPTGGSSPTPSPSSSSSPSPSPSTSPSPSPSATSAPEGSAAATRIELFFTASTGRFSGKLESDEAGCLLNRAVDLKRVKPGPNEHLDVAHSGPLGNFSFAKFTSTKPLGHFYAKVRPGTRVSAGGVDVSCLFGKSNVLVDPS